MRASRSSSALTRMSPNERGRGCNGGSGFSFVLRVLQSSNFLICLVREKHNHLSPNIIILFPIHSATGTLTALPITQNRPLSIPLETLAVSLFPPPSNCQTLSAIIDFPPKYGNGARRYLLLDFIFSCGVFTIQSAMFASHVLL